MQRMAHDAGECATAAAAAKMETLMALSSTSTTPLEDVAKAGGPGGVRWYQLYVYKDRDVTRSAREARWHLDTPPRAVTVDTQVLGRREADVRNRFDLPRTSRSVNLVLLAAPMLWASKTAVTD
ncbi:unnamed protein product, partial [Ascophyllum nodosum]